MGDRWFAIVDFDETKAFVTRIVYSGTCRQAVDRLYRRCDFSGPWDTEGQASLALSGLLEELPARFSDRFMGG
jgi:hypothetical protein